MVGNNKNLINKKIMGILPGSTVSAVLPRNEENIEQQNLISDNINFSNTISSSEEDNGYNEDFDSSDSNNSSESDSSMKVMGVVSGLLRKSSFKTKLIIIGCALAFISLITFLIILITPLMHLEIIDINGSSSSSPGYISSSYAYCDSINVDGQIVELEEYVAGVVQAEVGLFFNDSETDEALKAVAIAARTYAVYYTNGGKKAIENSANAQTYISNPNDKAKSIANATAGLVMTYNNNLFLSEYDSFCTRCSDFTGNSDGSYTVTYTKPPTGDKHSITLSNLDYVNIIVDGKNHGHGRGLSQYVAAQYAKEGMDYRQILGEFYSDGVEIVDLKKLKVGYTNDEQGIDYIGTYTNVKTGKIYKNYKQYLYRSDDFTFEGKDHLANVGCGTNATAIILSGEDSSITPMSLYIENNRNVGTFFGNHYPYKKESYDYCLAWNKGYCTKTDSNTSLYNNDMKEKFISNLDNGGTAILFINYSADKCTVDNESWTGSQHFFSVLDYNPVDRTIYISNPGTNSSSQNGWISVDKFNCVHVAWLLYSE